MTNHHVHGSSLLQARKSQMDHHSHRSSHVHKRDAAAAAAASNPDETDKHHAHSHEEFHRRQHHQRHDDHQPGHQHQARQVVDLDSIVTQVIQTVSVIQYVDGTGATLSVSTLTSPPRTQLVDQLTGLTVDPSVLGSVLPTPSVPNRSLPGVSYDGGSSAEGSTGSATTSESSLPLPSLSVTSSPSSFSSSLSLQASSSSSGYPSFQSGSNSTRSASPSAFGNSTLVPSFLNSTTSSSTTFSSSTTTSSETSLTPSSSTTMAATATLFGTNGGSGGSGAGGSPGATSSATPTEAVASSSKIPPTSTLVGSVVGGICGLALLIFAALFILRWRKRQQNGHRLGDGDGDGGLAAAGRALPPADPSGSSSGGGTRGFANRMSERGMPFAIPATLAALSGHKRVSTAPSEEIATGERGFYRISGRKLPSVLQHGGDGYTNPNEPGGSSNQPPLPNPGFAGGSGGRNPHDSTLSGVSFYRDSEGFFGGGGTPRLAVGSPMRPESGVPVMQPGPARTPVTEQSPVFGNMAPLTPPPPRRDPVGRSHSSQDGSRGSGSRFSEQIS